jgi:hypothetical protein
MTISTHFPRLISDGPGPSLARRKVSPMDNSRRSVSPTDFTGRSSLRARRLKSTRLWIETITTILGVGVEFEQYRISARGDDAGGDA